MKRPILYAVAFLAVLSCSEPIDNQSLVQSKPLESFKTFRSDQELEDITNKIPGMTDQELDAWEKENSFVSYRSVFKEAEREWDALEAPEGQEAFLNKYSDILTIENSGILPKIDIRVFQSIVNREGLYEANGMFNKVIGDFIVTVNKNEYGKLKGITSIDENNYKTLAQKNGATIIRFAGHDPAISGRIQAACSASMEASYFYNQSNCRNDRQVYISAKSYIVPISVSTGRKYQLRVEFKVWGRLRTGTWCNWKGYATALSYRNISFSIPGHLAPAAGQQPVPNQFAITLVDYAPEGDRTDLIWDQAIGDAVTTAISAPAFTRLHAEGSSRGVSGNWAVIDCQ